jgi:glycosyltransferase involved in cell wall biosynthesis
MNRFYVVIPFYNEESGIEATLDALAAQSDRDFALVFVDNMSTDRTAEIVRAFAIDHPEIETRLIQEPIKGTGTASDAGFRFAIDAGATHILRTDADCLPDRRWVANIRRAFAAGAEFVAGRIEPRRDQGFRATDALMLPLMINVAQGYAKLFRRGHGYKTGWVLVAGNNMAIEAGLYVRSGGFPHTELSEKNEDRVLADRVRILTDRIASCDDVVVYNSIRRVRAYGYVRTLLWYWDRKYRPALVDVR